MHNVMTHKKINFYLFREMLTPTIMGVCLFTVVVLIGRILRLAEMILNKGVPVTDILLLFIYTMASFLVLTLPFSFLMGILIAFGRLSADSEIVALKASGVGLTQMMRPTMVLAVCIALITALLSLSLAPASTNAFRSKLFEIASKRASTGIQPQVFNSGFDNIVIYTSAMDGQTGTMSGVFISDERLDEEPSIIAAHSGQIISDATSQTLTLHLEEGSVHRETLADGEQAYQVINFQTYDINLDLGGGLAQLSKRKKKLNQLSGTELLKARDAAETDEMWMLYAVEFLDRMLLPLTPILFALIGLPLGIQSTRSGRGGGFAIGLIIFLTYYIIYSLNKTLTLDLGVTPYTMFIPPLLFLFGGGYLYSLAIQEKRIALLEKITGLFRKKVKV